MKCAHNRELGKRGEELAVVFLRKHGLRILERNWRDGRRGEIDIIAFDVIRDEAVIVEVKTRSSELFGSPFEVVDAKKMARMHRLAISWIHESGYGGCIRFDVVALLIPRGSVELYEKTCAEKIDNIAYIQWEKRITQ